MNGAAGQKAFSFRLTPGFFAHLFKAVFKQHHQELAPLLRRVIPEDAVVFDVGAHAGQFAKLFAKLAPKGRVYAFEPGTYARAILRAAVRMNGLKNVAIVPLALGAKSGVAILSVPVKRSGSYGFGLAHIGETQGAAEIEAVGMATLDETAEALGIKRLDFVKADIEGYELRLIEGAQKTLARFKPALLIEFDATRLMRAGDTLEALWRAIEGLGYRAHEANAAMTPITAPKGGDVLWLAT